MHHRKAALCGAILAGLAACAQADQIVAHEGDALAESQLTGPSFTKIDDWDARAGEWFGNDSAWIMPFQLPDLGMIDNPFVEASFRGELAWRADDSGGEIDNIDLYMLDGTRSSPDVYHDDYDAPATLLQDDFFTPDSWEWTVARTSDTPNQTLADLLNAAYDGGNGVGEYVFLRFSYDGDFTVQEAYVMLATNADQSWEKPTIEYTLEEDTIVGSIDDAMVEALESGPSITLLDSFDGRTGEWYGEYGAWVMPFELPDLGNVAEPFTSVSLRTYLYWKPDDSGGELDNVDLYALDEIRPDSIVFHEDFHAPATLIQDDYYTPDLREWTEHTTNTAGDAALTAFLNAAYDNGNNIGDFVFLRMTYDGMFTVQEAYRLAAANAGFVTEWPTLVLSDDAGCAADFNNDGAVNTQDVLAFLNAWNLGDDSSDCNNDNATNTQDVICFLNAWTAGC